MNKLRILSWNVNGLRSIAKKGLFEFELEDDNFDLYNNICIEYLNQLNAEIKVIHSELVEYELTENE